MRHNGAPEAWQTFRVIVAEERVCAALGIASELIGFGSEMETPNVVTTTRAMVQSSWMNGTIAAKPLMGDGSLGAQHARVDSDQSTLVEWAAGVDALVAQVQASQNNS